MFSSTLAGRGLLACVIGLGPGLARAQPPTPTPAPVPADAHAGSSPAQSGAPVPAGPPTLNESVIVTATRGAADRDTSPASSAVVTREAIDRRAVTAVDQALVPVEGVYAYRVRGLADNEAGIGMRGFSGRGGGQSRVLVLVDGQPINNGYTGAVNWTALALADVDRVEVVRGPFSSLYGGNAMGGVVNVLTRPIDGRSAELFTQAGAHRTVTAYARGNVRLWSRLGLGVSYERQSTDGYANQDALRTATDSSPTGGIQAAGITRYLTRTGTVNYAVGRRGDNWSDRHGVRARAEYTFGSGSFGTFQYLRQATSYGYAPYASSVRATDGRLLDTGAVVFEEDGRWRRLTLAPSNYLGPEGGSGSHLYQAQSLRSTARGQWRLQAGLFDVPGDRVGQPGAAATLDGGPGSLTVQASRNVYGSAQWNGSFGPRHVVTAGADVRQDRATIDVFTVPDYRAESNGGPRDTFSGGRALTAAAFVQDEIRLHHRASLTVGARYDDWHSYDAASQVAVGVAPIAFESRGAGALTGKAALVYRLAPSTILRTSVGSSFRSPTVFDLYRDLRLSSGQLLLGNPELDPERLTTWEIGVRHDVGTRLALDVAYYENRIRDLVQRAVDFAGDPTGFTSRHVNAGRALSRGTEVAVTWRPTAWLTARPTYTSTDARIVRNDAAPATVGKYVTFVPRHAAAGTVTATVGRLAVTGTARYQSAVFATDTNTDVVRNVPGAYDRFTEVDLAATHALTRHVQLAMSVENLLDRHYFLFYRSPGRMASGSVRVRF
jgi:iron complex outermembrane receptor protein